MKAYSIILLILGLGVLTGYWGVVSDRMARSFQEGQASVKPAPEAKAGDALCIKAGKRGSLESDTADRLPPFE